MNNKESKKINKILTKLKKDPFPYILMFISAVLSALWYKNLPINVYPDSEQYIQTALAICGKSQGDIFYYRTWGYPLFIILTGVTALQSFTGLLIFQASCSVLSTFFVYKTLILLRIRPKAAFCTTLIVLSSFAFVIWQNVIMTDQISIMFLYLCVFASVLFLKTKSKKAISFLIIAGFFLYLLRPAAALIFGCCVLVLFIFLKTEWKKLLSAVAIFLGLILSSYIIQDAITNKFFSKTSKNQTFAKGSMAGRMFFFNIYGVGPQIIGRITVEPANGSATQKLSSVLEEWAKKNSQGMQNYAQIIDKTINTKAMKASDFVTLLLSNPDLYKHSIMWLAMDQTVGAGPADEIFAQAGLEAVIKNPKILLLYYTGVCEFFLVGDVVYNTGTKISWDDESISTALLSSYLVNQNSLQGLKNEQEKKLTYIKNRYSANKYIVKFLFYWQTFLKITAIFSILPLCGAFLFAEKNIKAFFILSTVILFYQATTSVVFAAPHFRYISPIVPLLIMLGSVSIFCLKSVLKKIKI